MHLPENMDFKKIIQQTSRYNFHSHTQFCDGRYSMEQFVEAAVEAGFEHWGFSPHSPIPIGSPCNMLTVDVKKYLEEVARLRNLYGDRINLYAAMEIDYLGKDRGPANAYFHELPLDYRIGSVHFIPSQDGEMVDVDGSYRNFQTKMERYFHGDIRYVVNRFFDNSLEMVAGGGFDIIGHFDKIAHNASHFKEGTDQEPWFVDRVNELIDAIIGAGIAVEINTKARREHHRFFPDPRYWKRLVEAGVTILVNSDAHHIDLIDASRPEALSMLASFG